MRLRVLLPLTPALALGTAFFVLTRFVRNNATIPRELSVDRSLTARAPASLIDLSHAVDVQHWAFVVVALVACLLLARRFRQALLLLLAEPLAEGLNIVLKFAINRQLPDQGAVLGWARFDTLLFPSGHVVRATVTIGLFVVFAAWPHARLRVPASLAGLALLALIGVTQVAVGGHLPLDVVGGYLLGATLVNLVYVLDHALAARRRPAPSSLPSGPQRANWSASWPTRLPMGDNWSKRAPLAAGLADHAPTSRRRPAPTSVTRGTSVTNGTGVTSGTSVTSGPQRVHFVATSPKRLPIGVSWPKRAALAAGAALVLLVAALSFHVPGRLAAHLATQPTAAAASPRALIADAAQHVSSARGWLTKVHGWIASA